MANHRSRVEKSQGVLTSVLEFVNKNWQGIAIILGIVAVFVWYQALGLGTLFNRQEASLGISGEISEMEEMEEAEEQIPAEEPEEDTIAQAPQTPPTQPSQPPITPAPVSANTGEVIVKKAQAGQGITHLARGALQDYLTTVKPQTNISREQKIYIEDYLKDMAGAQKLTPGKELSFSHESIERAIELSQALSQTELSNLTQYANRVPSLQAYTPLQ